MSGSFYALNSQYNSLLALLAELEQDKAAQDLENVLTIGNDAGNLNMTNINTITCDTLNYTTLNPSVPEVIGNITQVLTSGNDATNNSIINLGSVAMKAGGGGSLTFQDGSIQSTAFTGVAATPTLSAVITAGSSAGNQSIINLNGVLSPSTLPLNIGGFNGQDINLSALPQGTNPSGSVNIQTSTGAATKNWAFNDDGTTDLPAAGSLLFGGGSKVEEVSTDLELTGGAGKVIVNGDLELDAGGGGSLTFQDGTIQTTAYSGVVPTLAQVVASGNSASGFITGVTALTFADTTSQLTAYTGIPSVDVVLGSGSNAAGNPLTGLTNLGTNQITFPDSSIQTTAYTGANPNLSVVLSAGNDAGGQNITNVGAIFTSSASGVSTAIISNQTQISGTSGGQTGLISSSIDLGTIKPATQYSYTGGGSTQTATISESNLTITGTAGNEYTIFTNDYLCIDAVSGVGFSDNPITGVSSLSSTGTLTLETNTASSEQDWSFDTALTFPDGTQQSTAYTGTAGDQNLASVLGFGASGANIPMTSLGNLSATNWTLGAVGGGSMDSYLTNEQTSGTLFIKTKNSVGGVVDSLAIDGGTNGAVFGVNIDMGGNYIQGVQSIVSSSNEIQFTDGLGSGAWTGSGLTLLGTNLGTATGNYGIGIGLGAFGLGNLANNSIAIGANSAYKGTSDNSISLGAYAGGGFSASGAMGSGAVSIGSSSGAGASSSMAAGAVAVGNAAGGFGMNSNSVAIGINSGKGTLSTAPQGSNSICIGSNAGLGYGSSGVPANSLTISAMRQQTDATNLLTYNTTTKEVAYNPSLSINTANNTFSIGNNSGIAAANNTFAAGNGCGVNAGVNSYALGISSGNNTGGNQTSIGEACGNNSEQSVCIGVNAGNGTFNATCIGLSAGSFGLGANSVAIGTNASPTNGAADSICIVGNGITINPPNEGLFIAPIRSAVSATNQLTYNTSTKEIQYAPITSGAITYASANFPSTSITAGFGVTTYVSGTLVLPSAGTWAVSGSYKLTSGGSGSSQSLNGSSFLFSDGAFGYTSNSSQFFLQQTIVNSSLSFTHNINYIVTIPSSVTLVGSLTTGGFSTIAGLNGSGEFYAIKLA
jgi:hypothetical protein